MMKTYASIRTREEAIEELRKARRQMAKWMKKAKESNVASLRASARILELEGTLRQREADLALMTKMRDNCQAKIEERTACVSSLDQRRIELLRTVDDLERQNRELDRKNDCSSLTIANLGRSRDEYRSQVELLRSIIVERMRCEKETDDR